MQRTRNFRARLAFAAPRGISAPIPVPLLLLCALVAAVASLPLWPFSSSYVVALAVRTLLFIALGQAWNVVAGIGGMLSLGHGLFFGLGAYATGLLFNSFGLTPWLGAFAAMAAAAVAGLIVGVVTGHLRGIYFALATVVVSLGFEKLARYFVDLTGGDTGLAVKFMGDAPGAMQWRGPTPFLFLSLVLVVMYYLATRAILRSRFGLQLQAIHAMMNGRCAACGVNTYRVQASGPDAERGHDRPARDGFYMQFYLNIDPAMLRSGLFQAIQIQLPALIGGLGTAGGPVIGGALMILVSEAANIASVHLNVQGLDVLIYGLVLLLVVMRAPLGIIGELRGRAVRRARRAP